VAVREDLLDDGVTAPLSAPPVAGWDHEAWYLQSARTRGLEPLISWSRLADPDRLKGLVVRTFTFDVAPVTAGVYRLLLAGVPDHVIRIRLEPDRPVGLLSTQNWLYGAEGMFRLSWLYVPPGVLTGHRNLRGPLSPPRDGSGCLLGSPAEAIALVQGGDPIEDAVVESQQRASLDEGVQVLKIERIHSRGDVQGLILGHSDENEARS